MRGLFIALMILASAGGAAAQAPLPDTVAQPYVAYEAAIAAEDFAAAEVAAERAWRAAEAAAIDVETIGLLADNYGTAAWQNGNNAAASTAFERSAETLQQTQGATIVTGQTWRLAAQAALAAGNERRAQTLASRAVDLLASLAASPDINLELFRSRAIHAHALNRRGQIRNAGHSAIRALETLARIGPAENLDTASLAMLAGIERAMRNDTSEAAYYFTIAHYLYRSQDIEGDQQRMLGAWVEWARSTLTLEEREVLLRRVQESGYRPPECAAVSACDADSVMTWRDQFPADADVVDARPVRRQPPRYPQSAEGASLEGITLVRFTVTETGAVEDVETVFVVPAREFGVESVRAVRLWRYEPATVDGVPVRREGVLTRLEFLMQG